MRIAPLSWPAKAGHPGETCSPIASETQILSQLSSVEMRHLDGPRSRAMTPKISVNILRDRRRFYPLSAAWRMRSMHSA